MVSVLMMLVLAPVMWAATWIYSLLPRYMNGYFWTKYFLIKFLVWVVCVVAIGGGLLAQLDFIAHRQPSLHAREFYLIALLLIEGIPMLAICIYRYYQDPGNSYWFDGREQAKQSSKER